MSKLSHSNDETMNKLDKKRAIENGDEDLIQPEIGDLVEYGVAVRGKQGNLVAAAPRGTVKRVHKDGSIIVKPETGAPDAKLFPLEFCVLQKAG